MNKNQNETRNEYPVCLSAQDAKRLMGWSRAMTYKMIHHPEAGGFAIGGRWFFHRDRLLAWLEEQSGNQVQDRVKEKK